MNNYDFSIKFETDVKEELLQKATQQERIYIDKLFESCLGISPRSDENQFTVINVASQYPEEYRGICIRIKNVQMNLCEAIVFAIETAINFKMPESAVDYIKIALIALLKVYVLFSVKIDSTECMLLYYLFCNNAHNEPIREEKILNDIKENKIKLDEKEYCMAVKKLSYITAISIEDGRIKLKEKIFLNY